MYNNLVAIVGRANVGKSTLFNRLSIKSKAIVHDFPGVTRDRKISLAKLGPLKFYIVDTPGLEFAMKTGMEHEMKLQSLNACIDAQVIIFMVDYLQGITTQDIELAKLLRKYTKKVVFVVNKCDKPVEFDSQYYKLGFSDFFGISAEHKIGFIDLYESLSKFLDVNLKEVDLVKETDVRISVIGRPNTGKSTYINHLLKENRLVVSDIEGTTRDSIESDWEYKGNKIKIIDTAGLRRKANITELLEKFSASDSITSINFSHIVILMIDAVRYFHNQDYKILNIAAKEGRGIVISVNKCDLMVKDNIEQKLRKDLTTQVPEVLNIPVVFCSNHKDINLYKPIDYALQIFNKWNEKISTSKLNNWLKAATLHHLPPLMQGGRRIKFKYITQINTRPTAFKIFSNSDSIPENYMQYLQNSISKEFELYGFAVRIFYSVSNNPYHKKRK